MKRTIYFFSSEQKALLECEIKSVSASHEMLDNAAYTKMLGMVLIHNGKEFKVGASDKYNLYADTIDYKTGDHIRNLNAFFAPPTASRWTLVDGVPVKLKCEVGQTCEIEYNCDTDLYEFKVLVNQKYVDIYGANTYGSRENLLDCTEFSVIDKQGNKTMHKGKYVGLILTDEQRKTIEECEEQLIAMIAKLRNTGIEISIDGDSLGLNYYSSNIDYKYSGDIDYNEEMEVDSYIEAKATVHSQIYFGWIGCDSVPTIKRVSD